MVNHYQAGRRVEQEVSDHLGERGYDVIRSAASKGAVDLVAIHDGEILFIQVKKTEATAVSPAERQQLIRLADRVTGAAYALVAYKVPDERDRRRNKVRYRQLLGPGPREWVWWVPRDEAVRDSGGNLVTG